MTARPSGLVTEAFEAQRDRLLAVAYRVLGSHADAEDVVQEAWMRLVRQDEATIANLAGWLTTVVGRISLDLLRSRRAHPETAYGQESADLVVTPAGGFGLIVLEDFLDKRFVARWETGGSPSFRMRMVRVLLNPNRSFANLLRFKRPSYRDNRPS